MTWKTRAKLWVRCVISASCLSPLCTPLVREHGSNSQWHEGNKIKEKFRRVRVLFYYNSHRRHWNEPCSWERAHGRFAAFCYNLAKRYMFIKVNFPVSVFNIKKHNQKQPEIPTEMRRPLMWNVCVSTWNWASEKRVGGKKGAWTVHFGKTLCCF